MQPQFKYNNQTINAFIDEFVYQYETKTILDASNSVYVCTQ